jgi:hypothetical protein
MGQTQQCQVLCSASSSCPSSKGVTVIDRFLLLHCNVSIHASVERCMHAETVTFSAWFSERLMSLPATECAFDR